MPLISYLFYHWIYRPVDLLFVKLLANHKSFHHSFLFLSFRVYAIWAVFLLLPRLPMLSSQSYSNGPGSLDNLGSYKEIQPIVLTFHPHWTCRTADRGLISRRSPFCRASCHRTAWWSPLYRLTAPLQTLLEERNAWHDTVLAIRW